MRIEVKFSANNAAFEDNPDEVRRVLNKAADLYEQGSDNDRLYDSNGNSVGLFSVYYED